MVDNITIDRIQKMHPLLRSSLTEEYTYANNKILGKGVRLRFSQTLRTIDEQDKLYNQGRSDPGKVVTNARGGSSYHNYGLAFDIVLLYDKDNNGTFETASWNHKDPNWIKVVEYFKSKGWSWGGNFRTIVDYPHFEKTFGFKTAELRLKVTNKNPYPDVKR